MTLLAYQPGETFLTCVAQFTSYRAAVLHGQQHFGYGKFFVDTGGTVPSREDQLLLDPEDTRAARRARLLASL